MRRDGQTSNGFYRTTGLRSRCYRCDSENHLAPQCLWRDTPGGDRSPPPQERGEASKPSYSASSMETRASAQKADHLGAEETKTECEQSFSTTLDVGCLFFVSDEDAAAVLGTGATANLALFRWHERHNRLLERKGRRKVSTYPSSTRFRFGGGRLGEVRHAADIPEGIAENKGKFTALAPDADIPALLRKGAMEAPGGQKDFSRDAARRRFPRWRTGLGTIS